MHDFEKLELSTETLRELSAAELRQVAGGAPDGTLGCALIDKVTTLFDTFNCHSRTCDL